MLHLDQNHSSLSPPHAKSNLILSSSPRPDQHSLLSWSPPARDDRAFYQSQQEQSILAKQDTTPPPKQVHPPPPLTTDDIDTSEPSSSLGQSTSADAEEPRQTDLSSSSPVDPTSPTSSLTPPPDTTSPAFPSSELPNGDSSTKTKVEETEGEGDAKVEGAAEIEKASRASTPLSELSSAPDADDPPDGDKKAAKEDAFAATSVNLADGAKSLLDAAEGLSSKSSSDIKPSLNGHAEAARVQSSVAMQGAAPTVTHHPRPSVAPKMESLVGSRAPSLSIATPEPAAQLTSGSPQKLDPKVVTILEINAELLKACMEFQTRNISMSDAKAHQYAQRLQINLGWLASAADENKKLSHPLPHMQPPPPFEFIAMDRIQSLYSELPALFAKDIRRQSMSMPGDGTPQSLGANSMNGVLKRERQDDAPIDFVNKRRDTGESKRSTPAPSTPQGVASPAQPTPSSMIPPATPPNSMPPPGLPGPSSVSPSMPPPSMSMNMHGNTNEAQIAAARERARQMQIRQAMQQQQQQHQGMNDPMMSAGHGPQSGMSMPNVAGPSTAHNPQAQMAVLNSMGPMAMQALHVLQNPNHQMVQYLTQNVNGFQSMSLPQQIQHLQKLQLIMQARQQQRANAQAAQLGAGSMPGFVQGGGATMSNGNMSSGTMGLPNGSPTRISPTGQQGPMQAQGGFSMGGGGGGTMNMDPRSANSMAGLSPAQQSNLANLTPHQRQQLMLLQQQQQHLMRGGNGHPAMMNNQMFAMQQQQQRMAQQGGSSPHIGSPMLGGSVDNNFPPALRSNPPVPGIARNTRTPSDHAGSPMTPQLGQRTSNPMQDDINRSMMGGGQRSMNAQVQGGGMGHMGGGNMNMGWPQSQQAMQHMGQGQSGFGISPPGSAGFGGMTGHVSSPSNQQWNQPGQFPFSAGSPTGNQQHDMISLQPSRQTSATPVPLHQQQQLAQNSPMGDQPGLNEFDIFNWTQ